MHCFIYFISFGILLQSDDKVQLQNLEKPEEYEHVVSPFIYSIIYIVHFKVHIALNMGIYTYRLRQNSQIKATATLHQQRLTVKRLT